MAALHPSGDVVELAAALVDIPSESRHEGPIADAVATALGSSAHLRVERLGNTVIARTALDRGVRVLIGGHLDTVPSSGNLPHRFVHDELMGLGACDMKGGVAVALHTAVTIAEPRCDVTYVFYECEEVDAASNGLQVLADQFPEALEADFAILMEPSNAHIEAGCQGTLRAEVQITGTRAHSARSWLGVNAIHRAGELLQRLDAYQPREPVIDGLRYREGFNAVAIDGGVAGNVIPDACTLTVNFRFAPDRSPRDASAFVEEFFTGHEVRIVDIAPAARPDLQDAVAAQFIAAVGGEPVPKLGWTDVARFAERGIPALNYGPGDPARAHTAEEGVPVEQIRQCAAVLREWLMTRAPLQRQA